MNGLDEKIDYKKIEKTIGGMKIATLNESLSGFKEEDDFRILSQIIITQAKHISQLEDKIGELVEYVNHKETLK